MRGVPEEGVLLNCTFPYPLGMWRVSSRKLNHIDISGFLGSHSPTISTNKISFTVMWTISKKSKKYIITIIILFLPSLSPLPPLSFPLSPVLPIFLQSSHCLLSPTVLPDNKLVAFIRNLVNVWPGKFRDFNMIFKY